jgi:hypothetical protein
MSLVLPCAVTLPLAQIRIAGLQLQEQDLASSFVVVVFELDLHVTPDLLWGFETEHPD